MSKQLKFTCNALHLSFASRRRFLSGLSEKSIVSHWTHLTVAPTRNAAQCPQRRMMVTIADDNVLLKRNTESISSLNFQNKRWFQNEAEYHNVADESIETIQDIVEDTLEGAGIECELNYSAGVLTMVLPPHGTYIINKQTPNRQIWWSSPISGPRRYEYNEKTGKWSFSRDEDITLGETLREEFQQMYELELNVDV